MVESTRRRCIDFCREPSGSFHRFCQNQHCDRSGMPSGLRLRAKKHTAPPGPSESRPVSGGCRTGNRKRNAFRPGGAIETLGFLLCTQLRRSNHPSIVPTMADEPCTGLLGKLTQLNILLKYYNTRVLYSICTISLLANRPFSVHTQICKRESDPIM